MFTRHFNTEGLKAEGLYVPKPYDAAAPEYNYGKLKDPLNKKIKHKQVVDVSVPPNLIDETHQVRCTGQTPMPFVYGMAANLIADTGVAREIEYADIPAPSQLTKICTWLGLFVGCGRVASFFPATGMKPTPNIVVPWTVWAVSMMARYTIAGYICGQAPIMKAYCAQYVAGLKANDASNAGMKVPWREGQSLYLATFFGAVPITAAYMFAGGIFSLYRFFQLQVVIGLVVMSNETYRVYLRSGNRMFYSFQANKELERTAQFGSLTPKLNRTNDPDTGKTQAAHAYRYIQFTYGLLRDQVWENNTHENFPMHSKGLKVPNPYFNWQKSKQFYADEAVKVKSDLWALPEVLGVQHRGGTFDAR
jgi:hypothetical protein